MTDSEEHEKQEEVANLLHCVIEKYDKTEQEQEQEKYDKILEESCQKTRVVIGISFIVPFGASTRYYIMEIYMKSISSMNTSIISSIIFSGFMWYALASFIAASLGDKFGHDKMLLIVFLFNAIGVFIESIANDLLIFSIGYFINRIAIMQIIMAYIAFVLPHKYAIRYMSTYFSISAIIYLLGPIITGCTVDILNYNSVFWLNFIILSLYTLIVIYYIVGSQNKLQKIQIIKLKIF
eukprot:419489_1